MNLPKLAINNFQFTLVMVLLLTLMGLASFFTMPRSEDPQVTSPGSNVVVIFPGANPEDIEELVLDPIEAALNELEDIKRINAVAEDGLMVLSIEFKAGSDPDDKYTDVLQKVNRVRDDLPDGVLSVDVHRFNVSDVSIIQLALVSDAAEYRLMEKTAERMKNELERVNGVNKVKTWAYPEQEIRVSLNWQKMAQMQIPLGMVIQAIESTGSNIPGGAIDVGSRKFTIQTSGSYETVSDIENTVIMARNGKVVYLRDIASVDRDYEDLSHVARYNGKRAVYVTVSQQEGTNIYDVMDALKLKIDRFQTRIPAGIKMETVFDQSVSVSSRVNGFFKNLLQGVFLVGLVVLLAMSFRAALIVMLVIPMSIMIGLGFVDLSGFGLQQMSIAGLVIALGLLVDNAIVVTENVSRFLGMGLKRKEAAVRGTSQIGWAVVSSTATTVLAFLPIIMMQDVSGDFIRSMPVTVVFTLIASLLLSLTLTAFLSSRFLRQNGKNKNGQNGFQRFVDTVYNGRLQKALASPRKTLLIAFTIFLGSLMLFPIVGVSFFPKAEKNQFIINIDTPKGSSLAKTNAVTEYVETVLGAHPEVQSFAANIGRGNPRIYYNIIPKNKQNTHAQLFVELKSKDLDIFNDVVRELRDNFRRFPGAKIEVKVFQQGPPVEAPIAIKILGEDLDELKRISRDVEAMITGTEGTVNIDNPAALSKTDLHVDINRPKAGMMGLPLLEIDRTVRASISGLPVSNYRDTDGNDYNVVVRLPFAENHLGERKPAMSDFNNIYLAAHNGAQVPLRQVADITFKSSPMTVSHFNQERNVTITADVDTDYSVNNATNIITAKLDAYDWPAGYRYYVAGEKESQDESFGGMAKAVLIALIAIFGVLVLQFRSFRQPLIVFAAIPLALIGSVLALLITGYSFSFTAFVGITSLVGIVVNNSIILVDYTNQLRESGKDLLEALKEACATRFKPIILTTATTVGGLLPLTLGGGSMWAPMGWSIIGGLIVSTLLTLIVVPVLYKIFTRRDAVAST